ncbi:MAG TPA: ABC transporter permease [Candidatus Limnocylindria bacterium]|jgi:ABC-2 type transport system permease protein
MTRGGVLAADARALRAAALKELRQIRRYQAVLLSMLFWPVMLPAVWVLMGRAYAGDDPAALAAFASRAGTSAIAAFIFVGYAMYMWLSSLLWGPGTALRQEQLHGSLEAVFLTPASRLVPLFGPPLTNIVFVLGNFLVMGIAVWLLFGVTFTAQGVAQALVVTVVGVPAMYAFGSLFAAGVLRFGEVGPAVQFVRGGLSLLCGITFPLVMLPVWAQVTAAAMPPTYIVDGIRRALVSGASLGDLAGDLAVLIGLGVAIAALAVLVFGRMESAARRTGMLGRY